jgi:hypothetical protein
LGLHIWKYEELIRFNYFATKFASAVNEHHAIQVSKIAKNFKICVYQTGGHVSNFVNISSV